MEDAAIMVNILFICHGNICRSPMAEYIMKDLVKKEGRTKDFHIESRAVSYEEYGNPVYPPVKKILNSLGINCDEKHATVLTKEDYKKYDYLIAMDKSNLYGIQKIIGEDTLHKVHLLLEYTGENRDVSDPWYTRDFEKTYDDILRGCKALLENVF